MKFPGVYSDKIKQSLITTSENETDDSDLYEPLIFPQSKMYVAYKTTSTLDSITELNI